MISVCSNTLAFQLSHCLSLCLSLDVSFDVCLSPGEGKVMVEVRHLSDQLLPEPAGLVQVHSLVMSCRRKLYQLFQHYIAVWLQVPWWQVGQEFVGGVVRHVGWRCVLSKCLTSLCGVVSLAQMRSSFRNHVMASRVWHHVGNLKWWCLSGERVSSS